MTPPPPPPPPPVQTLHLFGWGHYFSLQSQIAVNISHTKPSYCSWYNSVYPVTHPLVRATRHGPWIRVHSTYLMTNRLCIIELKNLGVYNNISSVLGSRDFARSRKSIWMISSDQQKYILNPIVITVCTDGFASLRAETPAGRPITKYGPLTYKGSSLHRLDILVLQATFSNVISWMKLIVCWRRCVNINHVGMSILWFIMKYLELDLMIFKCIELAVFAKIHH